MPRRTLWILACVLALPLAGLAAIYFLVDPNQLRPVLEKQLSDALRRPSRITRLAFQPLPLRLQAEGVEVAEDPAFGEGFTLKAAQVEIHPRLFPLLRGVVEISRVVVRDPQLELRQNSARQWNYASLGQSGGKDSAPLQLEQLEVTNAIIGVSQPGAERVTYQRLGLRLDGYAPGRPFRLALSAQTPEGAAVSAAGTIEASPQRTAIRDGELLFAGLKGKIAGDLQGESLSLQLEVPSSPLAEAAPLFVPKGTNVKGDLSAKITATGTLSAPLLQGRIDVNGFEVSGGVLKQPVSMKTLALELTPDRISLLPAAIVSGATNLQAFGVLSNYATAPRLEATLLAPRADLSELQDIARAYGAAAPPGFQSSGAVKLQLRVHGTLSKGAPLNFNGKGSLNNARLEVPDLTLPISIPAAEFHFAENSVAFDHLSASVGSSNFSGSLRVSNFRAPHINWNLSADRLSMNELRSWMEAPLPSSSQAAAAPPKLTASGNIAISRLELESLLLERVTAQTRYDKGQVLLDPLRASLYGGMHAGALEIDLRPNPPVYHLRSKLERVESGSLLAAVTAVKGIINGPLGADLQLSFSPAEPAALARSLKGKLNLRLDQGRIAGFNLTNGLAGIAKFLGFPAAPESFTQFVSVTGDLELVNGVAQTQNLQLNLANLVATVTGSMNLADQSLDLRLVSTLDRKFSDQVGGNRIGGFMTVALANAQGNLVIPATIRGTFQKPVMAPDPGAMAKLKLDNLAPKNPRQVIEKIDSVIGILRNKKQ